MVVFARNDGNLTRMEVLLGIGQMQGVLTVLVNDVEIPLGCIRHQHDGHRAGTTWRRWARATARSIRISRTRAGSRRAILTAAWRTSRWWCRTASTTERRCRPYRCWCKGFWIPVYAADGTYTSDQFSSNPAWILLDILRRSGWAAAEIDLPSFAAAAAYCDEQIAATDLNGNAITLPRFQCNLVLQNRRSAGDVVRGVRNARGCTLTYGPGGVLQAKSRIPSRSSGRRTQAWSNSTEVLNGGWPSYEFGDGSNGFSGILRQGERGTERDVDIAQHRGHSELLSVEFQDALNGYQQDSYEMVDPDDVALTGQSYVGDADGAWDFRNTIRRRGF